MIFTNGRIIFPQGIEEGVDVICTGGRITQLSSAPQHARAETIDLQGHYLAPGFIDLHVHGALGRDTMEASIDAFRAICAYHRTGGTTSLLLTTATAPRDEIAKVLQAVRNCRDELKPIAGVHVEGPFISRARAGAQRREFIREPDAELIAQLLGYADVIRRMTLAPELPGALDAIRRMRQRGIAISGGHSDAWDEEARAAFEAGMRHVTHTFNCMSAMRRRDGERVAGLLEFALGEPEIACELIADRRHVSPTLMKMLYRAKGAGGICLVTDATAGAGLPEGSRFRLAGLDCIVADGACWAADRSALAGSAARMIDLVRTMVRDVGVPLHEAIAMATATPARALGSDTKGKIAQGCDADLVVLSPELQVAQTWVAGERVYAL